MPLTTLGSAAFMIGCLVVGFLIIQTSKTLPDAASIQSIELKIPLRVYSSEGLLISEFGNERRKPVSIEETPPLLLDAILAIEDARFYDHRGIDFGGLIRAALSNFKSGQTQQGASTITMQVARNFFLTREKTYLRKLREVLLAIKLEQILSKKQIFSLYLNKIFLGHRAYGFGAAADVYYGKAITELSLAEMAMLAGLPKAPSSNNPLRNPERAITRRNYVLKRLLDLEKVDESQYQTALAAPITASKHAKVADLEAPHIAEMVRAQLIEELGEQAYWAGLNVYTTVQATEQTAAQSALRKGLQGYDRRHGFRGPLGHHDLSKIELEEGEDSPYLDILSQYPNSVEQIPALILAAHDETALALTRDHGEAILRLNDATWAKRHLTANKVGETPKSFTELVSVGDIVYLQPAAVEEKDPSEEASEDPDQEQTPPVQNWQLSQIPNISGALISMEPHSGRILSLVGGYDFFLNKYNRAVQSIRQPGSNIKPFIYSAALDQGFTPATLISGAPIVITDQTHGTVWRPENYSGQFYGPTRMREALSKSMNLVSIRLLRSIGVPFAREYASRFGIDMSLFSPTLTMALGSGGITPVQMLGAYSTLANTGYKVEPYFIEYVTDRSGRVIYRAKQPQHCDECYAEYRTVEEGEEEENEVDDETSELPEISAENELNTEQGTAEDPYPTEEMSDESEIAEEAEPIDPNADQPLEYYTAPRIMSQLNNFLLVSMLKDVVKRGTARKALVLEREDLAGKTGTTNDYVDAWFTGFNSQVATTVWVGFDDPATLGRGEAGSKAALPIWIDYMREALQQVEQDSDELPEFILEGFVNRNTGMPTDELDPTATPEYFVIEELLPDVLQVDPLDQEQAQEEIMREDELGLDLINKELPEQLEDILPEERIIETEEDTEGLF